MNPIIREKGVCDPHIHIFGGKAYLYATHDNFRPENNGFQMTKWGIWSSEDLIHWTCEQILYPEDFYCGHIDQCWAVDAAKKGDKYYWYYSVGADCVGVGVSDSPAGPFREALGHALVGPDTPPVNVHKWDPCVFEDDDGAHYLICGSCFGSDEYQIARLNPDMCSLAEPLRTIPYFGNPCREDKATVHKENGRYYLSHASFYGVADNVYGPYTYCGNTRANIDHNSFFTYHGQTYQASGGMDNPNQYFRSSFLTYCHYRKNGEIAEDVLPTVYGVGQYDAGWERIEAEWFFDRHGAEKEERTDGGFQMKLHGDGSWIFFPHVCHMAADGKLRVGYSTKARNASLEIREHAPDGRLLGTVPLAPGEDAVACGQLRNAEGHTSLYLVVRGGEVKLDWFSLKGETRRFAAEAHRGVLSGGAETVSQEGAAAGLAVKLTAKGDGVTLPMDGFAGGTVVCKLRYAAQKPVSLRIRAGRKTPVMPELPATGGKVSSYALELEMEPGVNPVAVSLEADADGFVLDSLYTERETSIYRSYPIVLGDFEPFGNGIWNRLPQREWNPEALGGCYVNNLKKAGYRVHVGGIDGGDAGASVQLEIHYRNPNTEPVPCRVTVNGTRSQQIILLPGKEKASCTAWLRPGKNEAALTIEADSASGVALSAISILPE